MKSKTCTKCSKQKPIDQFPLGRKYQSLKTGQWTQYLLSWCKACMCLKSKALYLDNPGPRNTYNKKYYKENRAYFHRKYMKDRKKVKVYNREYYEKNRERIRSNRTLIRAIRKSADEFKKSITWPKKEVV